MYRAIRAAMRPGSAAPTANRARGAGSSLLPLALRGVELVERIASGERLLRTVEPQVNVLPHAEPLLFVLQHRGAGFRVRVEDVRGIGPELDLRRTAEGSEVQPGIGGASVLRFLPGNGRNQNDSDVSI